MLTWIESRAAPIGARRGVLIFAKKAVEITGVAKAEAIADLLDRQIKLPQAHAGFVDQPLMYDGARTATLLALAMRMQLVVGDAKGGRIAGDGPAVTIMQFDHLQEIADKAGAVAALRSIVGGLLRDQRSQIVCRR